MAEICTNNTISIDLRSDTVSQPTESMRTAMFNAVLGDDVYGEDPTVNQLEAKCAEMFDKEAALFVPSGTMGNLISVMVHCNRRGEEAVLGDMSHIFLYEQGGAASIAGVLLHPICNQVDGTFSLDEFRKRIRGIDYHEPNTKLAIIECTHNMCGGKVPSLQWIDEFVQICNSHKIAKHMDGARIFHAATYLDVPVSRLAKDFDSVTFCLSKSLCAPVGSVIVGSREFIQEARRVRKSLGGGMRQAGILAAAGIVALDEIVPKLYVDHIRLKKIAQSIAELANPFIAVDTEKVQTNILIFHLTDVTKYPAEYLIKRLAEVHKNELNNGIVDANGNGIIVKICSRNSSFARITVYQQITDELVDLTIKKLQYCIREMV